MNPEDRIDFSALDPMRDPDHWQARTDAAVHCVEAVLSERQADPLAKIADWRRPLLVAASAALLLIAPVELALELRESRVEQVERLVSLSVSWGHGERVLSPTDFLRALAPQAQP